MRLTSERVIKAGVDIVSNENKYHPIRDYLESLVWDGDSTYREFTSTVSWELKRAIIQSGVMKMHMLAAIFRNL